MIPTAGKKLHKCQILKCFCDYYYQNGGQTKFCNAFLWMYSAVCIVRSLITTHYKHTPGLLAVVI